VDFDELIDRTASDSVKWAARKSLFKNEQAIPMWVADMDFAAPAAVVDALTERVQHAIYGYGVLPEDYYPTVQDWLWRRHGWQVTADSLFHVPGVLAGVSFALSVVTQPGDKVLIQPPVYHPFRHLIANLNRVVVNNPLKLVGNRYIMDYEDLENKLKDGVKAVVLCSPHNPVGRVWERAELERFADLCHSYGVFVVSDEIHADLILPGHRQTPFATVSEAAADNSVTFIAPSKTFNLAGFHAAMGIASNEKLRESIKSALQQYHVGSPDVLAKVALQTAYAKGEKWLDALLPYLAGNIEYIREFVDVRLPELKVTPIEGTYLLWLDCRGMNLSQDKLQEFMVHEAGIAMNEGSMFGEEGTGFMRMNVACPHSVIKQAMNQLERAMVKFRQNRN